MSRIAVRAGTATKWTLILALVTGGLSGAVSQSHSPGFRQGRDALSAFTNGSTGSRTYHIELDTVRDCLNGDCPWRYSEKNFAVSQDGHEFPLRIGRNGVGGSAASDTPPHLLVLFAPGASRPSDRDILEHLRSFRSKDWLIGVARPDGSITPYVPPSDLSSALAAKPALSMVSVDAGTQMEHAVHLLEQFPGRRVLILSVLGSKTSTVPKWADDLWQSLAPFYIVDGGKITQEWIPGGGGGGNIPWGGWDANVKERTYYYGAFHEVNLGSAMKHAIADGRFDYDLRFDIPAAEINPSTPITLTLINAKGLLRYDANAILYGVKEETDDGKIVEVRIPVPQKLDVEFK